MKEITLLGNQNTKYEYDYNPKILERFENKKQIVLYIHLFEVAYLFL